MKKSLVLSCLVIYVTLTYSQTPVNFEKETWSQQPAIHAIDKKYQSESAVVLSDKRTLEFIDDAKNELQSYKTFHKIIHINDDKGIEAFNKVYLPVTNNTDIVDIKARTILPNGKVIEIDKKNIKDLQEDDKQFKIFAMEGLEKGCEVEYYYTYVKASNFFGREVMQARVPVLDAQFNIISPERLLFEAKIFNNAAKPLDTVINNKKFISITMPSLAGAEEEKYANYTSNLARIEYKLAYNTARTKTERLFTWNDLAKRMYAVYNNVSDKETKKVNDLVASQGWEKLSTEKEKIIAAEHFLKTTIGTREDISSDDADNIEKIVKNKIASFQGMTRLFGAVYKKLGINIQFVLTGDRSDFTLDKNFENWNNCENSLIYFPSQKKYLSPTRAEYRYPWFEPNWGNTNGLFCVGTTIGNFTTAIADIKPIVLEDYTQSSNNIDAKVQLNAGADTMLVDIKQSYRGYSAGFYRAVFNFTSGEQQKTYLKEFVKFGTNSENIVSTKIENQDFESFPDNKPFILNATVKASELVEKAGNKVLVKIGDIIGSQVEMYQEKPRQFVMEIQYPHVLERKIELTIPDGYMVKNAQDLIINNVYKENGQVTMGFVSSYKQEGNKLLVNVLEEYRLTLYPLSQYEDFKKIINAAADFNKVVLVLEKK